VAIFLTTVFLHRTLSHRAVSMGRGLRWACRAVTWLSTGIKPRQWVAVHRKHHAFTDVEGDPHSPHGHGPGVAGVFRGLWHAHTGWLLSEQGRAGWERYAPDLYEDRGMRAISRLFLPLVVLSLALPAALGYLLTGTLLGAATGLLWGGLVRIFFVHHVTWSVNSICHFAGSRRFATDDYSTNVLWLALPSLGESWHHNHHAFPRSATHGLKRWQLDPSAALIWALERVGLARNVVRIPPERQLAREATPERAS